MKLLAILAAAAVSAGAADTIEVFGYKWSVPIRADWKIDRADGGPVLHLLQGREPLRGPRRPFQFAIAETPAFQRVKVEADVKPLGHSLMIVFAYQDAAHFDYAHFSTDTGVEQPYHNGIFHVYGGERVRISSPKGRSSFAASGKWYHAVLEYDGSTGKISGSVDGKPIPALQAADVSLGPGKVGLGSFDETAEFKNVKITGAPVH